MTISSPSGSTRPDPAGEPIGLIKRRDIKWTRSTERGEIRYVASDPLKSEHFSCSEADYQILQWVAPDKSYREVCEQFHKQFRPATLSPVELKNLLHKSVQAGVLRPPKGNATVQPRPIDRQPAKQRSLLVRAASKVVSVVQYQLSFGSPRWFLDRSTSPLVFLFTSAWIPFAILLFALATISIVYRWEEFCLALPTWNQLRSPSALIGYGAIFFVTRALHELGHATACRRFSIACRDVGLLMSFGMICPYVDISEGWKAKNRLHRLTTAIGGIYFELMIASIAALVWSYSTPSFSHTLAYQVVLVCSVTTLLFNANPLMKYDGYYILSDALGINNLREKSWQAFDKLAGGQFRGVRWSEIGLIFYFVGSLLNRILIIGTLCWFVYHMASQWQLSGVAIACFVLYGLCAMILWGASWTQQARVTGKRIPLRAQVIGWGGTLCVLIWAMTLPLPKRTWGAGVFKPGNTVSLYTRESGVVEQPLPEDGALVEEGQQVLVLRNASLTKEQLRLRSAAEQALIRLKSMDGTAYRNLQILDQKKAAELRLESIRIQAEELDRRMQSLVVSAEGRGIFKAIPTKFDAGSGLLNQASYQSSRYLARSRTISSGEFVAKDTLIGYVITDSDPHVECEVGRDQMDSIEIGTPVSIRMHSNPKKPIRGIVTNASSAIVANTQLDVSDKTSQRAIGRVLLRIDSEDLKSLSQVHGGVELLFHHFDQSMWDYLKDAIFRNARWR
ncbi:hypothetical protein SH449x_004062 [Pirellulaceae bacterium SH449]